MQHISLSPILQHDLMRDVSCLCVEFTNKIPVLTADDHRRRTDQEIQDSKPRQPNVWQQCYPVTCTPLCHVPKEQQLRGTQPTWLMNPLYQYQYGNPFFPYERQNFFDFNPRLCFDDSDVAWPIAPQAKPLDWEAQHNFSSDPRIGEALGYPPVPFGTPTLMGVEEETVRQQQTYLALGASAPSGVRLKLRQRFVGLQNLGNSKQSSTFSPKKRYDDAQRLVSCRSVLLEFSFAKFILVYGVCGKSVSVSNAPKPWH